MCCCALLLTSDRSMLCRCLGSSFNTCVQRNKLEMTDRELCVVLAVGSDNASGGNGPDLRQDPLDLGFWSFLTFLHHGMVNVERLNSQLEQNRA